MLATFNSLKRPQIDDNPANDLLISDVKCSLDNYVDSVKAEGFMEFSLGIPIHRVLPSIAPENACMGDEFQVLEQFRDKSVMESEEYELEVFLIK